MSIRGVKTQIKRLCLRDRTELPERIVTGPKVLSTLARIIAFLTCCGLLYVACFVVALDCWVGASTDGLFQFRFILIGIALGAGAFLLGRHKIFLLVPIAYVLFILVLPFIELSPVKPAVRAVRAIRAGMSEAEVRAILDRHFPEHGRFRRPQMGDLRNGVLAFVLDPNDGRYNAAIVEIKFSEGRCVTARFLPD